MYGTQLLVPGMQWLCRNWGLNTKIYIFTPRIQNNPHPWPAVYIAKTELSKCKLVKSNLVRSVSHPLGLAPPTIKSWNHSCAIWAAWRLESHDDVIKWKRFPRYGPFVEGIHRSLVHSYKGQWRVCLILSLICAWTNGWANSRGAGDLRHHRYHYDVNVMTSNEMVCSTVSWGWHQRKLHSSALLAPCERNPKKTGWFPSQRTRNAEIISML